MTCKEATIEKFLRWKFSSRFLCEEEEALQHNDHVNTTNPWAGLSFKGLSLSASFFPEAAIARRMSLLAPRGWFMPLSGGEGEQLI